MKYYVYFLVDPRDGKPFYVGKGCGKRSSHHLNEARRGVVGAKCERIREILASGQVLKTEIDSWHEDQQSAFAREKELIEVTTGLLNIAWNKESVPRVVKLHDLIFRILRAKGLQRAIPALKLMRYFPRERLEKSGVAFYLKMYDGCWGWVKPYQAELLELAENNRI